MKLPASDGLGQCYLLPPHTDLHEFIASTAFDWARHTVDANRYVSCRPKTTLASLAQDVFVVAFRSLDGLRDPDRFAGWLRQIAVNRCRNHARATGRSPIPVELPAALTSAEQAPDARAVEDAVRELVEVAPVAVAPWLGGSPAMLLTPISS